MRMVDLLWTRTVMFLQLVPLRLFLERFHAATAFIRIHIQRMLVATLPHMGRCQGPIQFQVRMELLRHMQLHRPVLTVRPRLRLARQGDILETRTPIRMEHLHLRTVIRTLILILTVRCQGDELDQGTDELHRTAILDLGGSHLCRVRRCIRHRSDGVVLVLTFLRRTAETD